MLESQSQSQVSTQDYNYSLETAQYCNQSLETAQYSTPYFISREELPQVKCNTLKTIQVSRLVANGQSEYIQLAWVSQSQISKMHQMDTEIDTGAGCNVMPLYKVHKLFGQE